VQNASDSHSSNSASSHKLKATEDSMMCWSISGHRVLQ